MVYVNAKHSVNQFAAWCKPIGSIVYMNAKHSVNQFDAWCKPMRNGIHANFKVFDFYKLLCVLNLC